MKNFKYLKIIFILFLVFTLTKSAQADLASIKTLYLERINSRQAAIESRMDRISNLSYINTTAQAQLINNFGSYNTNYLDVLKTQIEACSTEDEAIDLINSDWQLPHMVLTKSMFNYSSANAIAKKIQTDYQLVNDAKTFVSAHTSGQQYAFPKNNREFALKWDFIKGAYAASEGWTCRQYDSTDSKTCEAQNNLKNEPCFWVDKSNKCVGNGEEGADASKRDGDEKACDSYCSGITLKDCYQNDKCAANGLLEEYVTTTSGSWTCRQYDSTDSKTCEAQDNLKNKPCFWVDESKKCVGDGNGGLDAAKQDGDSTKCKDFCANELGLANCYQNNKCAANGLLEEYVLTAVSDCGNGITESGEDCDDGNDVDGSAGDFCYNNCTKKYLDTGDTTNLDNYLAKLDDYKSGESNSLDLNTSAIDVLLTNIYYLYDKNIAENEKLVLMGEYEESLENVYSNIQDLNKGIITEVTNILSL